MKNSKYQTVFAVLMIALLMSSCAAIGDIFKAGMGFGIIIVVIIIIVIVAIVSRVSKK